MPPRILLIEDEPTIADNVLFALNSVGFEGHWFREGNAGVDYFIDQGADLVLLDVGLPDIDGFEVCRQLHKHADVPVIFLTARSDEIDRVVGLEIGADDYVTKPFSPRELIARIKVILRRLDRTTNQASTTPAKLKVDEAGKRIWFKNQLLDLTAYEYGILQVLCGAPGRIFSRGQLMEAVWADPAESFDRVVDTHIKALRAKLRAVDPEDASLITHRGLGYSLETVVEP